jgi:hypothetical protein
MNFFNSEYIVKLAKLSAKTDIDETINILKKVISNIDTYSFGVRGKTRSLVFAENRKFQSLLRELERTKQGLSKSQ